MGNDFGLIKFFICPKLLKMRKTFSEKCFTCKRIGFGYKFNLLYFEYSIFYIFF